MSKTSQKLKVAVVSYVVIDNTYSGQKKRIYDLVEGLSGFFDVTYIEISDKKLGRAIQPLSKQGVQFKKLDLNYSLLVRLFIGLLHKVTFPFIGLKKSIFVGKWGAYANRNLIRTWDYDIVVSEYFMSSFFFKYITNDALKVIDMHDIQYFTLQEKLKMSKSIFRNFQLSYARNFEMKRLGVADALMAVNFDEINLLQQTFSSNYIFTPLTVQEQAVGMHKSEPLSKSIKLAYFAGLSSERSYLELEYIFQMILPPLVEKYGSNLELRIIGSSPSTALIKLIGQHQNAVLVGEVRDIQEAFKQVDFGINYWMGSAYGFRTRVLDVLATGTPVFLNRACVAGMGMDDSKGLFFYEETEQIITTIDYYLDDTERYLELSAECINVANRYSGSKVYGDLYENLIEIYRQFNASKKVKG